MRAGERKGTRGEQADRHLFPLPKIELFFIFLHHKITQNIDLCLLFWEEMLLDHHQLSWKGHLGRHPSPISRL